MAKFQRIEFWTVIKGLIFLFVLVTILYPFSTVVIRSMTNSTGEITLENFTKFFVTPYYRNVLLNSLKVSFITTALSVVIGVSLAYALTRYDFKTRRILNIAIILSLMSPPFIGAYAWIMLFGRAGFITTFLERVFRISMPTIYGELGIIGVFTFKMYPYVYLFTSGALSGIDASLEEAAESLGSSRLERLMKITIPVVCPSILAGAVMVFMSCISDFGVPSLIGQNYKVLATLVYEQYMSEIGTSSNFASAVSMIIIFMAALLLILQKAYINRKNYQMSSLRPVSTIRLRPGMRVLAGLPVFMVVLFSLCPQIVVIVTSFKNCNGPYFVEGWGVDNYVMIFTRMIRSIKNTYIFSLWAIVIMVAVGSLAAYLSVRKKSALTGFIDLALTFPYVIPGAVMGLCLISAFNRAPFFLVGTAAIMVLSYSVRKIPYTVRSASGFLTQMDPGMEEASVSLGISPGKTFLRITLPLMLPGVISGAILSWIETINELSSSIMLYTGRTSTISVSIFNEVARNSFGTAAAMATILTITTVLMLTVSTVISKGKISIV